MSALRSRVGIVSFNIFDGSPSHLKLPAVVLLLVALVMLAMLLMDVRWSVGHGEVLLLLLAVAVLYASAPGAKSPAPVRPAAAGCGDRAGTPPGDRAGAAASTRPRRASRAPLSPGRAACEPRVRAAVGAQGQFERGGPVLDMAPQGRMAGQRLAEIAAASQAKKVEKAEKVGELCQRAPKAEAPCARSPPGAGAELPAASPCPLPREASDAPPVGKPRDEPPRRREAQEEGAVVIDHQFFRVATASLDQGALRANAAKMLWTMLRQRLAPDCGTQRQLLLSLDGKLPDDLSEALWALQDQGCTLSRTVRCSLMVAFERKAPRRTLELYKGLVSASGESALDRAACNAALCAFAQLGEADEALQLFQRMCLLGASDFGMAPNGKSYGSAIRACTAGGKDKVVLTLFDCMEEKGIMPNRFAYHDVILSCVRLRKLMKAIRLYENMKRDGIPPCDHTLRLLIRTCTARGLHKEAQAFTDDFFRAKSVEKNGPCAKEDFADIGDLTTQAESD